MLATGAPKFNQSYTVQNGEVLLPATLGITGSSSTTVTVVIGGYDAIGVQGQFFGDATQPVGEVGTPGGPQVRRGSVQTYVDQHTLFLPLNLSYSCYDVDCSAGTDSATCKGNTCTSSTTDSSTLVDFDPSLVDGTQDCFSPSTCFPPGATATAVPVGDPKQCLFELPAGMPAGRGLNVRLAYQDMQLATSATGSLLEAQMVPTAEQEILSLEPSSANVEGFAVPDKGNPLQFTLAPGLCSMVQAQLSAPALPSGWPKGKAFPYHTVGTVQVSTVCPEKVPLLPFCAGEQNPASKTADGGKTSQVRCNEPVPLVPAPSAAYLVMDGSAVMSAAFGPQGFASQTASAFGNPVFKNTSVAFEFLDDQPADCTASATPYSTPGSGSRSLDFQPAITAQPALTGFLASPTFADTVQSPEPLDLLTAMRVDVGAYAHLADYVSGLALTTDAGTAPSPVNVAALMLFVNRVPMSTGGDGGAPDAGSGTHSAAPTARPTGGAGGDRGRRDRRGRQGPLDVLHRARRRSEPRRLDVRLLQAGPDRRRGQGRDRRAGDRRDRDQPGRHGHRPHRERRRPLRHLPLRGAPGHRHERGPALPRCRPPRRPSCPRRRSASRSPTTPRAAPRCRRP